MAREEFIDTYGGKVMNLFMGWDTGTNSVAYAVIGEQDELLLSESLILDKKTSLEARRNRFVDWVYGVFHMRSMGLDLYSWESLVAIGIESSYLGFHKNIKTVQRLSESIGAIRALSLTMFRTRAISPPVFDVGHSTAKKALTGSGKATKHGVQQAVLVRFYNSVDSRDTIEGHKLDEHQCDAIAVAVAARNKWIEAKQGF